MLQPARIVTDSKLPAVASLLGPDAVGLLGALVEPLGGVVQALRIRQVRYTPATSVTVQYEADVQVGDQTTRTTLVVANGIEVPGEVVRLDADGIPVAAS